MLIKHTPFGGEHDRYDRLSLNIWRNGGWWLPDPGTTGYGAKMHYDYDKNTATHNTIPMNQTNQPPSTPYVPGTHQDEGWQWLDCEADWSQPAPY